MNTDYLELSYGQVAIAALLVVVNAVTSWSLRLGLGRDLLVASLRMVVQLVLVGLVLEWAFRSPGWLTILPIAVVMTLVAGVASVSRTERRYSGVYLASIVSLWASSWIVSAYALTIVLGGLNPWLEPQYSVPLLGMILGNTLNGISLGLGRMTDELASRRDQVDLLLTLGATRWEAALPFIRQAVRTGLVPTINAMMITGIVSLPGMMTGQILSGVAPLEAVKYQIVIMFLIAAGTAIGTVGVVLLAYRRLFSPYHQFLMGNLRMVEKRDARPQTVN